MSPRDHNDAWREDPEAARRDDDNAEVFKPEVIEFPKDRKAGNGNGNGKSPEDDWRKLLIRNKSGAPKSQLANALTALRQAPEWQSVLAYDEFALVTMQMKPPPWLKHEDNNWTPKHWTDRDDALTADWLQHQGIGVNVNTAATAAETAAKDASFHPIKQYLTGLKWDGNKRVESFATTYLGADASPYHRAVSQSMLVAGVARVMRPGCKVDSVPILEGPQGKGKSSAIEALFAPFFSDDLAELGSKDAAIQIRCAWGIEIAELASMSRAEIEKVKAFISRRVDRFRPSYGRRVIEVPRQSVLFGTTNSDAYLKDETGGRRFWPIRCDGKINIAAIESDRDQLWAEAVSLFNAGTPWWLTDAAVIVSANEAQADRYVGDPWEATIAQFLQLQETVSIDDVLLSLGIERGRWGQAEQNRVARCLKSLHWESYRPAQPPRTRRYRRRPD
jgi:predicted P-loop ATPase